MTRQMDIYHFVQYVGPEMLMYMSVDPDWFSGDVYKYSWANSIRTMQRELGSKQYIRRVVHPLMDVCRAHYTDYEAILLFIAPIDMRDIYLEALRNALLYNAWMMDAVIDARGKTQKDYAKEQQHDVAIPTAFRRSALTLMQRGENDFLQFVTGFLCDGSGKHVIGDENGDS